MKKCIPVILAAAFIANLQVCANAQQTVPEGRKMEATSNSNSTNDPVMMTQKITPCIWVETTDARAVVDYYLSIFKDGKMKEYHQYQNPEEAGGGNFETATIELNGLEFNILAAGPFFQFNESVSFVIHCKDQAEVDYYWSALTANGGQESSCGWCKDKYGLSWQVVPVEYFDLINNDDPEVREKAMKNTFTQKKIILSELK